MQARTFIHIPTGGGTYSLIYRYAVVLNDGGRGHTVSEKSRFVVSASDSATGTLVPCAQYSFVAGGTVPGFQLSPFDNPMDGTPVYYRPWTMGNMKFPGLGGTTVQLDVTAAGCGIDGHFGYGYFDMSCSLFANEIVICGSGSPVLAAPDGFAAYSWHDSATFSTTYGTMQTAAITTPSITTTYAVILTPYTGYGCMDTLYTRVIISSLPVVGAITGLPAVCPGGDTTTLSNTTPGGVWSSSDTSTATVSGAGLVTGMISGAVKINYTVTNSCGSTTVTYPVTVITSVMCIMMERRVNSTLAKK
jgi:hypothetical protein